MPMTECPYTFASIVYANQNNEMHRYEVAVQSVVAEEDIKAHIHFAQRLQSSNKSALAPLWSCSYSWRAS